MFCTFVLMQRSHLPIFIVFINSSCFFFKWRESTVRAVKDLYFFNQFQLLLLMLTLRFITMRLSFVLFFLKQMNYILTFMFKGTHLSLPFDLSVLHRWNLCHSFIAINKWSVAATEKGQSCHFRLRSNKDWLSHHIFWFVSRFFCA